MQGTCEVCGLESITDGGTAAPRGEVSCPRCRTRYEITPGGLHPITPRAVLELRAARLGRTPPAWGAAIAPPRAPRHATLDLPIVGARGSQEPLVAPVDGPDLARGRTPARYAGGIAFAFGILVGVIGSSSAARPWLGSNRGDASLAAPSAREPASNVASAERVAPPAEVAAFDRDAVTAAPGAPDPALAAPGALASKAADRTVSGEALAAVGASPAIAAPVMAAPTMAAPPPAELRAAAAAPASDPATGDAPEPRADPQAPTPAQAPPSVPASAPSTLAGALARAVGAGSAVPASSAPPAASATGGATTTSAASDPGAASGEPLGAPAFDASAAAAALRRAAGALRSCEAAPEQKGRAGRVSVTFLPSGAVSRVLVEGASAGTDAGSCVARAFRTASVPAFTGAPVVVHHGFVLR